MKKVHHSAVKSPIINARHKRSENRPYRICPIFIRTDFKLWEYMKKLNYDDMQARMEITALATVHVEGLNKIYGATSFKYKDMGPYNNFSFALQLLKINGSCNDGSIVGFCKPNIDVSNYLNLQSLDNHDMFCLAIAMTYRDFTGGTIGLAWVGSPDGSSGGVCERWRLYQEGNSYVNKSLNTAIFTLSNYGARIPIQVSTLTLAHEIGHNFGSPHDTGPTCAPLLYNPNNVDGNYLMFASATRGTQKNNNVFSICSIGNITYNLDAIFNHPSSKVMCFQMSNEGFCGNQIVEMTSKYSEECDCGSADDCKLLNDVCCNSMESTGQCTLKADTKCSPSQGFCCNSSCDFKSNSSLNICRNSTECSFSSICTGTDAVCPKSSPKDDLTPCNANTQVCRNGECTGSICNKANWTVCYSTATPTDSLYDKGQLCYVSCLNPNTSKCISTGDQVKLSDPINIDLRNVLQNLNISTTGIQLTPGAPCDNYQGFCDVFRKCRKVDEDGPLNLLKKLFFSAKTADSIRDWVTQYWWAVLLIGVACIVALALFVKLCAVYTPSSNPKLKKKKVPTATLR